MTCLSTLLWSHQTADNSLAEFGPCVEKKVPEARILSVEMSLNVDFCRTNQEKTDLIAAFETFINGVDSIDCLKSNKCTVSKAPKILYGKLIRGGPHLSIFYPRNREISMGIRGHRDKCGFLGFLCQIET